VVDVEVIGVAAVAVPISRQGLDRPETAKPVEVEDGFQPFDDDGIVGLERANHGAKVAAVARLIRLDLHAFDTERCKIAVFSTLIEVPAVVAKETSQEGFADGFDVAERAQVLPVDDDVGQVAAAGRQARARVELVGHALAAVGRVAAIVVEGEASDPQDALVREDPIEIDDQGGFGSRQGTEATLFADGGSLDTLAVDADAGFEKRVVEVRSLSALELEEAETLLAEHVPVGRGQLDLDLEAPPGSVESLARVRCGFGRGLRVVSAGRDAGDHGGHGPMSREAPNRPERKRGSANRRGAIFHVVHWL
jgi:hypothetical protein